MPRRGRSGDCSECGLNGPASNGGHVSGCTFEPSPRNTSADVRPRGKGGGASRNKDPKRGRDSKGKFLPKDDAFDEESGKPSPPPKKRVPPYSHTGPGKCPRCGMRRGHTHYGPAGGD